MKKQIMTAFAVSTMMTLAMPFASFGAYCEAKRPSLRSKTAAFRF